LGTFINTAVVVRKESPEEFANFVGRNYPQGSERMSLDELNKYLNKMNTDKPARADIVRTLCEKMSGFEVEWLFRILLDTISNHVTGTMRGDNVLLGYLAPNAAQLYQSGMDIKSICIGVYRAAKTGIPLENATILGKPLRPMLLSKINCNPGGFLTVNFQFDGYEFDIVLDHQVLSTPFSRGHQV
jgi:hypothetical protein